MKVKRYTIAEAQKHFEKLIREAKRGDAVYIVDENQRLVQLVPVSSGNKRKLGGFEGEVSCTPEAFDPLNDKEMKDYGFE